MFRKDCMKYSSVMTIVLVTFFYCLADAKPELQLMRSYTLPVQQERGEFDYIPRSHPNINREARDKYFQAAGLSTFISHFDEVDRNVFYLRLRNFDLRQLSRIYPTIPQTNLQEALKILDNAK